MTQFSSEGLAILEESNALSWCEDHLADFCSTLPQETTRGAIREAAEAYILAHQEDEDFSDIREAANGTNGLFLGLVITVMTEYLLVRSIE